MKPRPCPFSWWRHHYRRSCCCCRLCDSWLAARPFHDSPLAAASAVALLPSSDPGIHPPLPREPCRRSRQTRSRPHRRNLNRNPRRRRSGRGPRTPGWRAPPPRHAPSSGDAQSPPVAAPPPATAATP
ncbi:Os05g0222766 [Oryza sativa Japonica Group]|uniref:Os05g0222766 protein n=1 Tax=Oryza sativa subsp. japonica TaxID=39947 RepID=A0A0P0WJK2_ORYSJ|nr:hypothetical protein DAI22_05g078100 [Oryza sativa Japonica Group]BAS92874.1 Os05g0222766 [Oryza sativa Japonica Group]